MPLDAELLHQLAGDGPIVLDGALATELERRGSDLADPLWSAKVLVEQPELIEAVHRDYFDVGARCAITASYQATPAAYAARGIDHDAALELVARSVDLAAAARQGARHDRSRRFVAGSVGPYGAYLSDGSEYRGDYELSREEYLAFHRGRASALVAAGADLLAFETIPKLDEALALAELAAELDVPAWYSFTLRDDVHLSDGTPLAEVAQAFDGRPGVVAVGVNCVAMELVAPALEALAMHTDLALIAYPNSGEVYDARSKTWAPGHGTTATLAGSAPRWRELGARYIGGCCRTTPADIAELVVALRD